MVNGGKVNHWVVERGVEGGDVVMRDRWVWMGEEDDGKEGGRGLVG